MNNLKALKKFRAFLLTPPPLRIKIFSLSTESRDRSPELIRAVKKTVAQSDFFYSRKTANLPFPQIW